MDLAGSVHHRASVGVEALLRGVNDRERLKLHVAGHAEEVLGIRQTFVQGGGEHGGCVAVVGASETKLHRLRAADPQGSVESGVLVGVGVQFRLRYRDVVVLVRDGQAKRDLGVERGILGKCLGDSVSNAKWDREERKW